MSFLRQSSKAAKTTVYNGMQMQSANGALPIPILWGVNQLAPNVVWSGDFRALAQKASGGKGGGNISTGYDYRSAVIMGLCEGPIAGIGAVWNSQSVATLASLGLTLFSGAPQQPVWSYLQTAFPSQALAYSSTAYVCAPDYDMGSSAGVGSISFEAHGLLTSSAWVNGYDADPALVALDFLTNPQYGVGFPAASIDAATLLGASGDASYQTYCRAAGLAISPALIDRESAGSILSRWLQLTNSAALWSAGLLKIIPYGDSPLTGTSSSGAQIAFNPATAPLYDLSDDDFLRESDADPIEVSRKDPAAASNMQILEIAQRSNYYDATPIVAFDQNAIDSFGLRIGATVTAHEICDPAVAQTAAQLILQRSLYIRNLYTFKLSWEYCLLEPMDIVTLTDPGLGLSRTAVRVVEIEEDDAGLLTITAEEFPAGTGTAAAYPVQAGSSSPVDRGVAPAPVNPPIIFEPPPSLSGGVAQVWIVASGGTAGVADPWWGGAEVWLSTDNAAYSLIGRISGAARQGVLAAPLAATVSSGPDGANAAQVDLSESAGALASTDAASAAGGATICLVGRELLAYTQATLSGPSRYALTGLVRGMAGSTPAAHSAGESFARLDDAVFHYGLPSAYIGRTLYVKLRSFNIFGQAAQDLSTCVAYSFAPCGASALGPVTQALAVGVGLDYGLSSLAISESDDDGLASESFVTPLDLGLASA